MGISRKSHRSPTSSSGQPEAWPPKLPRLRFREQGRGLDDEGLVPRTYALPELPWEIIAGRLEPVTISILRFDARLEASGLPPAGSPAAT